jgi:YD repeat-containing protein
VGNELTTYDYDNVGQLKKLTLPDGSFLAYDYDAAHRLWQVSDQRGNRIVYTLDAAGTRTREEIKDPHGQLIKTLTRLPDALGRVQTLTGVSTP